MRPTTAVSTRTAKMAVPQENLDAPIVTLGETLGFMGLVLYVRLSAESVTTYQVKGEYG
jgi:hypothetical protein